jgi:carboxylesterase type B
MEKHALPNTGLSEQRAALQWIQDYIYLLGGKKTKVSAWGESAGAGSISHHLISFGGNQDPLFSKATLQSPAFQLLFDRKGKLGDVFNTFEAKAGCAGQGIACLRSASSAVLANANQYTLDTSEEGFINIGPAADGNLARQLPALEFASGYVCPPLNLSTPHELTRKQQPLEEPRLPNSLPHRQRSLLRRRPHRHLRPIRRLPLLHEPRLRRAPQRSNPILLPLPLSQIPHPTSRFTDFLRGSAFACNARYLTNA